MSSECFSPLPNVHNAVGLLHRAQPLRDYQRASTHYILLQRFRRDSIQFLAQRPCRSARCTLTLPRSVQGNILAPNYSGTENVLLEQKHGEATTQRSYV